MKLTKPQKLIYDMEKYNGGTISIICGSMLVKGRKKLSELKQVVNKIYEINDALRIRIVEENANVCQHIVQYGWTEVEVLSFKDENELNNFGEKYAKIPLDLYGNLCEIKIIVLPNKYGILAKLHHMVSDAWTLSLLGTQFNEIINGEEPQAYSYADYVKKEGEYLQSNRYEKDKAFFMEQFKKCDEVTYISEKQSSKSEGQRKTFVIGKDETRKIRAYADSKGISAFMLFTTALSVYMNRVKMNSEKFYIGTTVLNRNGAKEKNTAGMFVNTTPMLIELDNEKSFVENLENVENTIFSVLRHQKFNYGDVLSEIRKEYKFTEKLYDVIISYQNATVTGNTCETTWYYSGEQTESLQIHIDDRDNEGIFRIHYDYLIEKFSEYEIDRLHEHICNLLFDAVNSDNKKIYELEILTDEEKEKLRFEFNNTKGDYPKDKCIYQLFEGQVDKTPDKVAVIADDAILTYRKLNDETNRIAHSLREKGIGVGDIVAFALPKKSYLISTMLGILKSGAAYLPIDINYPKERINYMLKDSNAKLYIKEDNITELYDNDDISNLKINAVTDNLCYCIYTSGSTGKPKMVGIKHKNLIYYVDNLIRMYSDIYIKMPVFTNHCVDLTVTSLFLPLATGGCMQLYEGDLVDNLKKILLDNEISIIKMTPTHMKMLTELEFNITKDNLKHVILGGENLATLDVIKFINKYGRHISIHNEYGPTETTVGCGDYVFGKSDEEEEFVSIGHPYKNTQLYIVDKYNQLVPVQVVGELCIAGDGVGAGYLNRPELTAEKFIDNPFGEGKLYKTGDLAYWREDGNIAYVGRNDFQVKIRGLRIELGEIENSINSIEGILQSVVVVRKNQENRQLICAFYAGNEIDAKDIRKHIGKKLPKYMLPHIFTHLDSMPLTASGKINRKELPEIELEHIVNDTEYVKPENAQQKELCRLIELVLETTNVGINDDFFDLGGDSLKAIEFVTKAHSEGIYFNLQNVFDYPTVKELCECIKKGEKLEVSFNKADFIEINKVLVANKIQNITCSKETQVGNLLLAGATGYLGIHILAEYLDNDTGIAYCLVRGKNKEDSEKRLRDLLEFYFDDKYSDTNRIEVVCADLQKKYLGLEQIEYDKLLNSVDTVINAAASVKHYGTYKYFYEINVEATKRLIDFCIKGNSKFIHISTLTVSGNGFNSELVREKKYFTETDLYIGQPLENVYARSKFEAEKVVFEAVIAGLQAKVLRMGNLTNRLSDGKFQQNYNTNAFLNRIRALLELKIYPESIVDYEVEFTPVDKAANAVMTITRNWNGNLTVFHVSNPLTIKIKNLLNNFETIGCDIKQVSVDTFKMKLEKVVKSGEKEHIFETLVNDMDENDQLNYDSNIRIKNDFTIQYLKKVGFKWSEIDIDYLRKYVEYFKTIGYFK